MLLVSSAVLSNVKRKEKYHACSYTYGNTLI